MDNLATSSCSSSWQSRSWLLTVPADSVSRDELYSQLEGYSGVVGQLERGTSGTDYLHWQLYLENRTPIRFTTLKRKLPKAHLEIRRGSRLQAYEYVTKADTRVNDERFEIGEIDLDDESGYRSDLEEIRSAVLDDGLSFDQVLLNFPAAMRNPRGIQELVNARDRQRLESQVRELSVSWVYGDPGVGKTSGVIARYDYGEMFRVTDYANPFDSYRGQPVLVLDEFRGQFRLPLFLNLADRYPMELPARYSNKIAAFETLVIVSNWSPLELFNEFYAPSLESGAVSASREAFLRRIHSSEQVLSGGKFVDVPVRASRGELF